VSKNHFASKSDSSYAVSSALCSAIFDSFPPRQNAHQSPMGAHFTIMSATIACSNAS
jgi:hypothetical protein